MRLMGHIIACFPNMEISLESADGIIAGGAEFLEVQFPFSDPNADGIIIQNACDEALHNGFRVENGFEMVKILHNRAKIIIVTYANILYKYGIERFVKSAKKSGAWGIIVPDLLFDNDMGLGKIASKYGLHTIHLITPNTPKKRMKHIIEYSSEIVYVVARRGITGDTTKIDSALLEYLSYVREICDKKIALGFGINSSKQIEALERYCDIVVVGSYFVEIIANLNRSKSTSKMEAFEVCKKATKSLFCKK